MASFLRGKQAGMSNDLSAKITADMLLPDDQARYGINSQISCLAYDPVQSLLAVGTSESKYGPGHVSVFGQKRVQQHLDPKRRTSIRRLCFTAERLISVDTRNELIVWDLLAGQPLASFVIPGQLTSLVTDPMLDWALLGLANGEVIAYDLDRERLAKNFRLPNFWRDYDPRASRLCSVVDLALHPRDIGQLLIGYTHGAAIYSFKQNAPLKFFQYVLTPGAPGGNGEAVDSVRRPKLTHALWHPTGTFVLTAHEDASLVFWDPKDGRILMARTLADTGVDRPVPSPPRPSGPVEPYGRISWCCKANPEDTGLLVSGGQPMGLPGAGLTFLEFGLTPTYATSSWQLLSDFFLGKRQVSLSLPPGAQLVDYLLIPRASPYFAGAQDPIAVLALLSSGELATLSFPSGYPISPTNMLHPSLTLVHPYVNRFAVSAVDRERWLAMAETRSLGEPLLRGGAEALRHTKRTGRRAVVQAAHGDGTVRLWDAGRGDQVENPAQLQVDVARALGRYEDVDVTATHMAGATGEFAVGTRAGEVVLYRWGANRNFGRGGEEPPPLELNPGGLTDISARAEPGLKEGLQPFSLYAMMQGAVTALRVSDVGFVAAGSEGGFVSIIDLRGPSVVFHASLGEFAKQEKRSSFLKSSSSSAPPAGGAKDYPTVIEFGVLTLEGDGYSSIACFVGTSRGKVVTLKLLPSAGGYSAKVAGVASFDDRIVSIDPIETATGKPAAATGPAVAGLRNGQQVNGTLVVVTQSEIRLFKPPAAKGASKSFDDGRCDAAAVSDLEEGAALATLFSDRTLRLYTLPGLKELARTPLPMLDASRTAGATITPAGDVFAWAGPSELAVLHAWGAGRQLAPSSDTLLNPQLPVPPRPTISGLQWISGTQYVSPTDLDLLVGGPDRPPSKRMMAAAAAEERAAHGGGSSSNPRAGTAQEGWGEYLTRQLNERTEKLGLMGEQMDGLSQTTQGWADDVNKFVKDQKRSMLLGSIKGKFL